MFDAINGHKGSKAYKIALDADAYWRGENPTIMKYEKTIYDMQGKAHIDRWTANHKIATNFFYFAVTQENQFLLSNGANFGKEDTKEKLGKNFDTQLQKLGIYALCGGVSFGFFNLDHIDAFSLLEFVPLYDEENGALMAGIRFWQIADDKPLRATLYELDGYTDYIKDSKDKTAKVLNPKRPYKIQIAHTEADGDYIYDGENYPEFPIVPMWANDKKQSELVGRRGTLDAFDLLNSNLVNNVEDANLIYWVLTNCNGMDEVDDAKFIEQIKSSHIVHADGDAGAKAEAHSVEVPVSASELSIETIQDRLYKDFMCFNPVSLSGGNKTATEINAAYETLNNKVDAYEYCVNEFVMAILKIAGIEDEVSFTRSQQSNKGEQMEMLLSAAEYLDDDTITEQVCNILGLGDRIDEIIANKRAEEVGRIEPDNAPDDIQDAGEAIDTAEDVAGRQLNGAQTQSLIQVLGQLSAGILSEGQAVNVISTAIGVTKEEALAIIRGD